MPLLPSPHTNAIEPRCTLAHPVVRLVHLHRRYLLDGRSATIVPTRFRTLISRVRQEPQEATSTTRRGLGELRPVAKARDAITLVGWDVATEQATRQSKHPVMWGVQVPDFQFVDF